MCAVWSFVFYLLRSKNPSMLANKVMAEYVPYFQMYPNYQSIGEHCIVTIFFFSLTIIFCIHPNAFLGSRVNIMHG